MGDEAFHAAEARPDVDELERVQEFLHLAQASLDPKGDHAAEARQSNHKFTKGRRRKSDRRN